MDTDAPHEARNPTSTSRVRQEKGRTLKLRASCDHCSNAKIRCDQDRPSCQRCLYINIPCNYSASRRMGRTSVTGRGQNRKSKAGTSARRNSKEDTYCTDTASKSSDSPINNTQRLPDTMFGSYGQDYDYATSQPWTDVNFMSDLSETPNLASFSGGQADHSHISQSQLNTTHSQTTLFESDHLELATPFHTNTITDSEGICMGAGQPAFQQLSPDLLTSSNTISDPAGSITHQGKSCVELASSTLQSLSLPSNMCASSPQPIPLHTVESVLAISRGAISAFNTILQCLCSHSSSFTLTLALMISKILECYSAICRCSTSSPTSGNPLLSSSPSTMGRKTPCVRNLPTPSSSSTSLATMSPTSSCSSSSMPRGPHNIVLGTPIAIGGYKIDPDDEYIFILQLVLSELRKVGKLVDAFAIQYSTAKEDSVYKSLEQFLRCQVHKARSEVDAVLRRSEDGA